MKHTILLVCCLLAGCAGEAERTDAAGKRFEVARLFTHDGCTVYRFYDAGRHRYFTNCSGSTSWEESCGKSCAQSVEIPGGGK